MDVSASSSTGPTVTEPSQPAQLNADTGGADGLTAGTALGVALTGDVVTGTPGTSPSMTGVAPPEPPTQTADVDMGAADPEDVDMDLHGGLPEDSEYLGLEEAGGNSRFVIRASETEAFSRHMIPHGIPTTRNWNSSPQESWNEFMIFHSLLASDTKAAYDLMMDMERKCELPLLEWLELARNGFFAPQEDRYAIPEALTPTIW